MVKRATGRVIWRLSGVFAVDRSVFGAVEAGSALSEASARLARGEHHEPHAVLGAHPDPTAGRVVIRTWQPGADAVTLLTGEKRTAMRRIHGLGLFEITLRRRTIPPYSLEVARGDHRWETQDPYRFAPTLGELDLYLITEGRHERLWEALGARPLRVDGVDGAAFAVWAPGARGVCLAGDFNSWEPRRHPLRSLGASGVWELFVPGAAPGDRYKLEVHGADGLVDLRADPLARAAEVPPRTASVVAERRHVWRDEAWMATRGARHLPDAPMAVYELHLPSWRQGLGYRELADVLPDYVADLGFTHVELMPVMEHPFGGSWGYQVTGYYAPTARLGSPDELRLLIDRLHQREIGVLLDWVPAHFPADAHALARFDGSALYEHADPRKGAHPDWGTLIFNYGRHEVRNFLVANALYWLEEFHADGLRVDAVASMLYLDYSRGPDEWLPNRFGGNENLEAIEFLRELNATVYGRHPGIAMVAEESTAWPGVSRPVHDGGLGFGFKWNMGFMHDSLEYFAKDPVHRAFHHGELTRPFLYSFAENFVLPISHDEVVHGKGSLLTKMPGDDWQKFANLRAYLAYMWAHPGKKLLFMGQELGQRREWDHDSSVEWDALAWPPHAGVRDLVRDLNRRLRELPALHARDADPGGLHVIDAENAAENVVVFARLAGDDVLVCVANLSPVPRLEHVIGMPHAGRFREVLNTDATAYGGSGIGNLGVVEAVAEPWRHLPARARVALPPLAVLWLVPER
jgi:1,4-alpha-glucan branching enzyme